MASKQKTAWPTLQHQNCNFRHWHKQQKTHCEHNGIVLLTLFGWCSPSPFFFFSFLFLFHRFKNIKARCARHTSKKIADNRPTNHFLSSDNSTTWPQHPKFQQLRACGFAKALDLFVLHGKISNDEALHQRLLLNSSCVATVCSCTRPLVDGRYSKQ